MIEVPIKSYDPGINFGYACTVKTLTLDVTLGFSKPHPQVMENKYRYVKYHTNSALIAVHCDLDLGNTACSIIPIEVTSEPEHR